VELSDTSFGSWLRRIPLKKDNRIFYHDGRLKPDQSSHVAVLDITLGKKDLQQCADAIIRLRTEWLVARGLSASVVFYSTSGQPMSYDKWKMGERYRVAGNKLQSYRSASLNNSGDLNPYLECVFSYAGTHSLKAQLRKKNWQHLAPGDVLIEAGSPGHAMLVIDVAIDAKGRRAYLLAQGFMPAQDMHVVVNPVTGAAWYYSSHTTAIDTPGWSFTTDDLCTWP
jgi:hypothetical protein